MPVQKLELDEKQRQLVRNMFRLQYSLDRVALAVGTTEKRLNTYLRRKSNALFFEQCKREKVLANVFVRESLYKKAVGVRGVKGRPKVIQDGAVIDNGSAEIPDVPGDMSAMRMWLEHRDNGESGTAEWGKAVGDGNGNQTADELEQLERKSDKELVDYIVKTLTENDVTQDMIDNIKKLPGGEV